MTMKNDIIDILCATDDNYCVPLSVLITSIIANKDKDRKIRFFIIDGGITEEKKKKLYSLSSDCVDIIILSVSIEEQLQQYELPDESYHSVAMYYRVFASEILPNDVDRILYLDCDMIVKKDLIDLYNENFDNNLAIGCRDIHEKQCRERLGLDLYINSGMMMINLKGWREENIQSRFVDYIRGNSESIVWHDQDIINCVLSGRIKITDNRWNVQVCTFCDSEEQNIIGRDGFIIHYISSKKPWVIGVFHPFFDDYQYYLSISPFSEIKFRRWEYMFNDLKKTILMKVFNLLIPDHSKRKKLFLKGYDSFLNHFIIDD